MVRHGLGSLSIAGAYSRVRVGGTKVLPHRHVNIREKVIQGENKGSAETVGRGGGERRTVEFGEFRRNLAGGTIVQMGCGRGRVSMR